MKNLFTREQFAGMLSGIFIAVTAIAFAFFLYWFDTFRAFISNIIGVLRPFIIGFVIAYLLAAPLRNVEKLMQKLFSRKKPRPTLCRVLAMILVYLLMFGIIGGLIAVVIPRLIDSVRLLMYAAPNYLRALPGRINEFLAKYDISSEYTQNILGSWDDIVTKALDYLALILPNIIAMSASISNGISNTVVGWIISIYMLYGKERFSAQAKKLAYALMSKPHVDTLLLWSSKSNTAFSGYVTGKILDSFIIGLICYAGMNIFGFDYALLISVVIGVTDLIPFFGPIIGAIPSIFLLLIVDPMDAFWFTLFIIGLQQLEGNVISPRIIGESIGLSSFWIILAILLGGGLFGFTGMLISIPVFAVLYAIVQTLVEMRLRRLGLPVETKAYLAINATGFPEAGASGQEAMGALQKTPGLIEKLIKRVARRKGAPDRIEQPIIAPKKPPQKNSTQKKPARKSKRR